MMTYCSHPIWNSYVFIHFPCRNFRNVFFFNNSHIISHTWLSSHSQLSYFIVKSWSKSKNVWEKSKWSKLLHVNKMCPWMCLLFLFLQAHLISLCVLCDFKYSLWLLCLGPGAVWKNVHIDFVVDVDIICLLHASRKAIVKWVEASVWMHSVNFVCYLLHIIIIIWEELRSRFETLTWYKFWTLSCSFRLVWN